MIGFNILGVFNVWGRVVSFNIFRQHGMRTFYIFRVTIKWIEVEEIRWKMVRRKIGIKKSNETANSWNK